MRLGYSTSSTSIMSQIEIHFLAFSHQLQELVHEQKTLGSIIKGSEKGLDLYVDWIHAFPYRDEITQINDSF